MIFTFIERLFLQCSCFVLIFMTSVKNTGASEMGNSEKQRLFAEVIEHLTESQKLSIYYFLNELKLEQNLKQRPALQETRD